MKMQDAFYQFVEGKKCSRLNLEKAMRYYHQTKIREEKKKFDDRILFVIRKCLDAMLGQVAHDPQEVKGIYSFYGFSDQDFNYLFSMYLLRHREDRKVKHFLEEQKTYCLQNQEVIFEKLKKSSWNIKGIAKNYFVSPKVIRKIMDDHFEYVLGIHDKDMEKYMYSFSCFQKFLDHQKLKVTERREVYYYYTHFASSSEKEQLESYASNLLHTIINMLKKHMPLSPYLDVLNMNDFDLYTLLSSLREFSNEEKLLFFQHLKPYYEYCQSVHFKRPMIREEALKSNILIEEYLSLSKAYQDHFALDSQLELEKSVEQIPLLDQIKDEKNELKIQDFLLSNQICKADISYYCYQYRQDLSLKEQNTLEKQLLSVLKKTFEERKEIYPTLNGLYDIIYKDYLANPLTLKEFCLTHDLPLEYVQLGLNKIGDRNLVLKVKERLDQEKENTKSNKMALCRQIIQHINEGVPFQHGVRPFNLLDYFLTYAYSSLHVMHSLAHLPLTGDERKTLNLFFGPLRHSKVLTRQTVLNTTFEFQTLKDEQGFPIQGTGILVSEEAILQILDLFEQHQIPLYDCLIYIAAKEYANGHFVSLNSLQTQKLSLQ